MSVHGPRLGGKDDCGRSLLSDLHRVRFGEATMTLADRADAIASLVEPPGQSESRDAQWPYKDKSEGPFVLERAVIHAASRSKLAFLQDASMAWERVHNGEPVTRQGIQALKESREPREM